MLPAVVDHLWQSLLFTGLVFGLVATLRAHSAKLRFALWALAAAKWLLPFALLHALGRWLGYPATHSADPVPDAFVAASAMLTRWLAPSKSGVLHGYAELFAIVAGLALAVVACRHLFRALELELPRARAEAARQTLDPDDVPPGVGFMRAAAFTFCTVIILAGVIFDGAIADQTWRRELLIHNTLLLRTASIEMKPAAPGMGLRARVIANQSGVIIRNTNIRDLVALVYGINHYAVWADQLVDAYTGERLDSWLTTPRYDIVVRAEIREPEEFDPYALRQRVTKLLAEEHALTINLNSECQPPCGRYRVPLAEAPL
jgi:hypothetical protein